MRVAVTGASGFLGGHLSEALVASGYDAVGLVRRSSETSLIKDLGLEIRHIDLATGEGLLESTKGVDAVIHLAAYYTFHGKWELYRKINVEGTRLLLEAMRKNGVRRLVYCSTTEVIGPVRGSPADESTPPSPQYDYGRSKLMAEQCVWEYGKAGMECTVLRPSGIYGPRNLDDVSYWTIISFAKNALPTRFIVGSGKNLIQFVHVKDVVQGFMLALERPEKSVGETYIISDQRHYTYEEVYSMLGEICGRDPPRLHIPKWLAAILVLPIEGLNRLSGRENFLWHLSTLSSVTQDRAYSIKKAAEELGYRPKYDLRTGLKETFDWYVKNGFI